jgi:hypothetical protein
MTYHFKTSTINRYSIAALLIFCLSLGFSTVAHAQKLSADWYGTYKMAVKFGAAGAWAENSQVLVVSATSATIDGTPLANVAYTANGFKWKTAEYSAEVNFAVGSKDTAWFEKPEAGKLFTGNYTDLAGQGKIDIKGVKQ